MKKALLLSLLSAILLLACSKEEKKAEDSFIVNGISDLSLAKDTEIYLPLEIKHVAGTQEKVTITVEGLPSGVTAEATPQSGTPTYVTSVRFHASEDAIEGSKQIRIKAAGASGATKTYDFALNVTRQINCGTKLIGTYDVANSFYNDGVLMSTEKYTGMVISYGGSQDMIEITDLFYFAGGHNRVHARAICDAKTLEIPKQEEMGEYQVTKADYSGAYDKIYIEYTLPGSNGISKVMYTRK